MIINNIEELREHIIKNHGWNPSSDNEIVISYHEHLHSDEYKKVIDAYVEEWPEWSKYYTKHEHE